VLAELPQSCLSHNAIVALVLPRREPRRADTPDHCPWSTRLDRNRSCRMLTMPHTTVVSRQLTKTDLTWVVDLAAAQRGACVCVVTHQPGDEPMAELLASAGCKRTTDYYEGTPGLPA
jgi:hypothetical protein